MEKIIYESNDGKYFYNEKDCQQYEIRELLFRVKKSKIDFYDNNGNYIKIDINTDIEKLKQSLKCVYIIDPNAVAVEGLIEFFNIIGINPKGLYAKKAVFFFDINSHSWTTAEDFEKNNYAYLTAKAIEEEQRKFYEKY